MKQINWTTTRSNASTIEINDGTTCYYAAIPAGVTEDEAVSAFVATYEGPETDEERAELRRSLEVRSVTTRTIRSGAACVTVQRDGSSVWTVTAGPEAIIGERWNRLDDLRQSLRHRGLGNFRKSYKG